MSTVIGNKTVSNIQIDNKTVSKIEIGGKTAYELEKVKNPSISCTNNVVTMTCATSGATIRYSTNGGSTYSTYSSPITISSTKTYTAYATKSGMADSGIVSYKATYVAPKLPTPTITKTAGGTYNGTYYVEVDFKTSNVSGVTYYVNYSWSSTPSDPTTTSYSYKGTGTGSNSTYHQRFNNYSSGSTCRIKVLATKSGYSNSDIKSQNISA